MTDVDLFGDPIPREGYAKPDPPRVRNTDPQTSQQAATSLGERALGARCQELFALIEHYGGLTTHQLVALTGYDRDNTARRITDLTQAGWITDSGLRRLGPHRQTQHRLDTHQGHTMTATLYVGDVFQRMAELEDHSFDLIITSPPFLALRSYLPDGDPNKHLEIGSEQTPADYLDVLLALTAEWRRLLAPHGSIAIELGDTYADSGGAGGDYGEDGLRAGQAKSDGSAKRRKGSVSPDGQTGHYEGRQLRPYGPKVGGGWPLPKSLCGIPTLYTWSLAYGRNLLTGQPSPAGQWRIRNLKPWIRTNPPVGALGDKERPATSYITVATLARDRWFDLDAVRTAPVPVNRRTAKTVDSRPNDTPSGQRDGNWSTLPITNDSHPGGAPPLDWWHQTDATIDRELAQRAGKVGDKVSGNRSTKRVDQHDGNWGSIGPYEGTNTGARGHHIRRALEQAGILPPHPDTLDITPRGYAGSHYAVWPPELVKQLVLEMCPPGGTVLDPFVGSGTTLMVCEGLGRHSVGIDLDPRSAELARERCGMFLEIIDAGMPHAADPIVAAQTPGGAQQSA